MHYGKKYVVWVCEACHRKKILAQGMPGVDIYALPGGWKRIRIERPNEIRRMDICPRCAVKTDSPETVKIVVERVG